MGEKRRRKADNSLFLFQNSMNEDMYVTTAEILWEEVGPLPNSTIELPTSEGMFDLHNFARFTGAEVDNLQNQLRLKFVVPEGGNLIFGKEYFFGTILVFDDLSVFQITERDGEMPKDEDQTLEYLSVAEKTDKIIDVVFAFRGGRKYFIQAAGIRIELLSK